MFETLGASWLHAPPAVPKALQFATTAVRNWWPPATCRHQLTQQDPQISPEREPNLFGTQTGLGQALAVVPISEKYEARTSFLILG